MSAAMASPDRPEDRAASPIREPRDSSPDPHAGPAILDNPKVDDVPERTPSSGIGIALRAIKRYANLADVLRVFGAGILIASLSQFLLAGVDVQNDLQRFALLLLQTAIFTGGGLAVGRLLDDGRGARLFFAVALLSVPVGFAVLGAMVYSIVPLDAATGALEAYPDFAFWQASTPGELLIAAAAALLVLVPTTCFAFAVMARRSVGWLAPAFLGLSSLILVPVRDPAIASIAVSVGLGVATWLVYRRRESDAALLTLEGRFALATLFVPALLIAGRVLALSPYNDVFVIVVGSTVMLVCRQLLIAAGPQSRTHYLLLPLAAVATTFVGACSGLFDPVWAPDAFGLFATAIFIGAALVELGRHSASQGLRTTLEMLWILGVLFSAALHTIFSSGFPDAAFIGATLLAVALWCVLQRRWGFVATSVFLQIWVLGDILAELGHWIAAHGWESLALLGITALVTGSLVQRYGAVGSDLDKSLIEQEKAAGIAA